MLLMWAKRIVRKLTSSLQKSSAPTWARTRDLILKRDLLYQLSYGRIEKTINQKLKTTNGARGETRTHMILRSEDFKSAVYTIPPPGPLGYGGNRSQVSVYELATLPHCCTATSSGLRFPSQTKQFVCSVPLEATAGIAPACNSFAESCLTTWLRGHKRTLRIMKKVYFYKNIYI